MPYFESFVQPIAAGITPQGKPLCVVLNKCDAPAALAQWELEAGLRLAELAALHAGRLSVIYTSALAGGGLEDLLAWLAAAAESVAGSGG